MLNPYIIAASLAGIIGAYVAGNYVGANRQEAKDVALANVKLEESRVAYAKFETLVTKKLAEQLAAIQSTERVINHETQKIIERPIYRNVCLDADGLRLVERARTGGNKAGTSAAVGKVP